MFPRPPYDAPQPLTAISFNSGIRLLVLAPHPDDFDSIAVTLHMFQRLGALIYLTVMTSSTSGVQDGYGGAYIDADKAAVRECEQLESCAFFGLSASQVNFLRLTVDDAGELVIDDDSRMLMAEQLVKTAPDIVFMPHGNDSNITHQRTFALFDEVAQQMKLKAWVMLNQDPKTVAMRQDLFMPFDSRVWEWKAQLLRLHGSQQERNLNMRGKGFDARIMAVNEASARTLGIVEGYAEIFELMRYGT